MLRRNYSIMLTISLALSVPVFAGRGAGLKVDGLRCEYRFNPLGLDTPQPRLSWLLESPQRGQRQTAYQALAATTPDLLSKGQGDLWDSGKVSSGESVQVIYGGQPLRPGQRVYWKVRAWDREDRPSGYSPAAWWEMGLLGPADWRAAWITRQRTEPPSEDKLFEADPAPLFRKEFPLEKKISRARVYVSGLGYYELRLNGQRVGDQVLDPGWTTYSKRVLYSTYDVTDRVKRGRNAGGHARQRVVQSAALAFVGPYQSARESQGRGAACDLAARG
jgi:alpha-L-rhamnosidase